MSLNVIYLGIIPNFFRLLIKYIWYNLTIIYANLNYNIYTFLFRIHF